MPLVVDYVPTQSCALCTYPFTTPAPLAWRDGNKVYPICSDSCIRKLFTDAISDYHTALSNRAAMRDRT